jgi:hypothetical protein
LLGNDLNQSGKDPTALHRGPSNFPHFKLKDLELCQVKFYFGPKPSFDPEGEGRGASTGLNLRNSAAKGH